MTLMFRVAIMFGSMFTFISILTFLLHTVNSINVVYLQEPYYNELVGLENDENPSIVIKRDGDNNDYFLKHIVYPDFHSSPLQSSRRTRVNRLYGKPLWISRHGR
ncbi:unnamed protein product [Rotaria magnacalcarata]|uniref:Uncharacterized protein n=1 Tax=Rotaria magnacalcarata TaxID=392030 RepID=A0A819KJP9_9BILA|nr:unnamed protein product [Rotaria magnacalcarata]CAF1683871.1 unnamed protein product [Rotaria magnacalcarata]CAF1923207.1 unnamed protein product [Rotaria magnacalcarata]CAF2114616.1 unnamed protein product [Rotaria magnacalcarata]CAF2148432.1 unnamed protein product [Rotaria magnacalcarata]